MSNSFYNHGAFPSTGSAATSASMRAELDLVAAGFDLMPTLSGNSNKFVVVNSTGTALTQTSTLPSATFTDTLFTIQDDGDNTRKFQFNASTVTPGATRIYSVPDANTTLVGTDTTQTLTNKTLTAPVISSIVNTGSLTLPTSTDTLVGRATTDTLTNKTLTSPVIATIVNSGTLTLPTSTDTLVGRATTDTMTNKTLTSPVIGTIVNTGTLTLPTSTDTLVGRATTDTLTNKTLTSPVIGTIVNTGTLTLPTSTDTLVGRATTDTLTNKTLTSPVIGTIVNTGTLTLPTSTDTLVGRATTDTLTNKTLTSPVIGTIVNSGTLTLPTSTDTLVGRATTDTLTNKTLGAFTISGTVSGGGNQINNVIIGTTTPLAGAFTTITASTSITNSGLTSGRVPYSTTAGLQTDSANLTFNGTTLTANTIGAFTLGGTVAGGGNQINNVIIGTTTPLAGAFTTVSATGTITHSTFGQLTNDGASDFRIDSLSGKTLTLRSIATDMVISADPGVAGTKTVSIKTSGVTPAVFSTTGLAVTGTFSSTLGATIQGLTVGLGAGAVATNTAVGASALAANTTGNFNAAGGYQALILNAGGQYNTAFGAVSLAANVGGTDNSAFGTGALNANTSGSYNTGLGRSALQSNTTASNNTAVGYQAGYTNTTGGANTFFGYHAGYSSNAVNGSNVFIGYRAGKDITTGVSNVVLGGYMGNQSGLDIRTASNYIVLSDGDGNPRCYWTNNGVMVQSISYTDNFVAQIKNSTATRPYGLYINFSAATPNNTTENFLNCADSTNEKCIIYSSGTVTNRTGTYNAFSDIKLKQDVVDAGSQWDDIKAVRVRKFRLKDDVVANPETKPLIGVIAQELELTSAGLIDDCVDKEGDVTKSVKYSILYMKAVKALQEAMERIEQLEARLDAANL